MRRIALLVALGACGPSGGPEGECRDSLIAGDLVITEVFADYRAVVGGSGVDDGKEWFEIFNNSDRPIELEGLRIEHGREDNPKPKVHVIGKVTLSPGQFFVLGNAAQDLLPPYVDYGYGSDLGDFFNSDGGKLALKCGSSEIDSAIYLDVNEGSSRQLTAGSFPDYLLNDDQANWCEGADTEFEAANFGTPGAESDCTPVIIGQCNDGGTMRDAVLPVPGDLIITEVMPNPAVVSDTEGEWFEVLATRDIDLNGVALDRAGDSTNPRAIESPDCLRVAAGEYALFAKNADPAMNGGLPDVVRATFTFSLVDGTVAAPGDVQLLAGSTVLDAISWTGTTSGRSHALDPDFNDPTANDSESNFCDGTATYGPGDNRGTPGAGNDQCVLLPPPGMCDDNGTVRAIVKPAAGELVISEYLANPAPPPAMDGTTDNDKEWFEITNVGGAAFDLNELSVTRTGVTNPTVVQSVACISVPAGGFAVFARSADPARNGMLPAVHATFNFSLVDSGVNRNISVLDGATTLDTLAYTATGTSANSSVRSGFSVQLDPDNLTTTANDLADPMAGLICQGAAPYGDGTNQGTPGAANAQCP